MRPIFSTCCHGFVESFDRQRASLRIAADLVEGEQAVIAVESGILERLRHQRAGELLNFRREPAYTRCAVRRAARGNQIKGQRIAQKVKNALIGSEPFSAGSFDRFRNQRTIRRRGAC